MSWKDSKWDPNQVGAQGVVEGCCSQHGLIHQCGSCDEEGQVLVNLGDSSFHLLELRALCRVSRPASGIAFNSCI